MSDPVVQLEDHIVRPRYLRLWLALCHPLEVSEEGEHVAGLVEAAANDKEVVERLETDRTEFYSIGVWRKEGAGHFHAPNSPKNRTV